MSDYPFCKTVDLSRFERDDGVVFIARQSNRMGRTKDGERYYPTSASLMRLERVISECGSPDIELSEGRIKLLVYFRPNARLSDFGRKQLFDRAVADRRQREAIAERRTKKRVLVPENNTELRQDAE